MQSKPVQRLIDLFSRFPTIGQRTSARFVFYLIKAPRHEVEELVQAILDVREQIQLCEFCFRPFEIQEGELCEICSNQARDRSLICIVEKESDLEALEKSKAYKGVYFILGGTVGMLRKEDLRKVRIEELKQRLAHPETYGFAAGNRIREIILATNPTAEGEATALYLERVCAELNIPVTRLGRGLPIGGEIEYADEETLRSALDGRR